jgi:ribosomal protein L11 methylase PrmA
MRAGRDGPRAAAALRWAENCQLLFANWRAAYFAVKYPNTILAMPYLCCTFSLAAALPAEQEEAFIAELWEAGTLGVEYEETVGERGRLRAYFPADRAAASAAARHSIAVASLQSERAPLYPGPMTSSWVEQGIKMVCEELVAETDWLAVYRERARPFAVGRTFWIDPRDPLAPGEEPAAAEPSAGELPAAELPVAELSAEPLAAVPAGRTLLRVPARAAFGIGSHESTALALELLEDLDVAGARVLDVGTGTGILALAALRRGADSAVAFDLDLAAPFHARANARLNGHPLRLFAGRLAALARPVFDLALVNVIPEQILPELPGLVRLLAPAGALVLSGILAERGGEVLAAAGALGLTEAARRQAGEWVAFVAARRVGAGALP